MPDKYAPLKLAWRVIGVTTAFYSVAFAALGLGGYLSFATVNLQANVIAFTLIILEYWPIFLLIYYPRWRRRWLSSSRRQQNFTVEDVPQHSWRVWSAWFCITALIAWSVVEWRGDWALVVLMYVFFGGPFWLPPIVTIVGALLGDLLFRLYRMNRKNAV